MSSDKRQQPVVNGVQADSGVLTDRLTLPYLKRRLISYFLQEIAYGTGAILVSPFSREESKSLLNLYNEHKNYARWCYELYINMKRGIS